ncbi:MAG: hypothetical protein GY772_22750, partial [bacterium]|nr:hypothetical protein [bacterium]
MPGPRYTASEPGQGRGRGGGGEETRKNRADPLDRVPKPGQARPAAAEADWRRWQRRFDAAGAREHKGARGAGEPLPEHDAQPAGRAAKGGSPRALALAGANDPALGPTAGARGARRAAAAPRRRRGRSRERGRAEPGARPRGPRERTAPPRLAGAAAARARGRTRAARSRSGESR